MSVDTQSINKRMKIFHTKVKRNTIKNNRKIFSDNNEKAEEKSTVKKVIKKIISTDCIRWLLLVASTKVGTHKGKISKTATDMTTIVCRLSCRCQFADDERQKDTKIECEIETNINKNLLVPSMSRCDHANSRYRMKDTHFDCFRMVSMSNKMII